MELELLNFKKELDRRFKNSKIKNYKFPKSEVEEHKVEHHDIRLPRDKAYNLPEIRQSSSKERERQSEMSNSKSSTTHRAATNKNFIDYEKTSKLM